MNILTKEGVKALWHDVSYKTNEVKPEIFLISGGLSLLAGTILACYRTEKAKKALADYKTNAETLAKNTEIAKKEAGNDEKALKQVKFDNGKAQVKSALFLFYEFIKIYGVAALLWFGGFTLITGGFVDLRRRNTALASQLTAALASQNEYRARNAQLLGPEVEQKVFHGVEEEMIDVVEKDPETGLEHIVQKPMSVFTNQPGSIFARNFSEMTSDCFDPEYFAENKLEARIEALQHRLDTGSPRCVTGLDVYKILGFDENALGEDEYYDALVMNGISGNARKVPDPEMRKIKYTLLQGYEKRYDEATAKFLYYPVYRLDWNFYPLQGRV